jgi:hypothetical protein
LNPDKGLPIRTGHRLQHWAATLQGFSYKLVHRKGNLLCPADALSRLPRQKTVVDVCNVSCNSLVGLPLTFEAVAQASAQDPVLSKILSVVHKGWPHHNLFKNDPALAPYFKIRDSLSIVKFCLMFCNRVVIPEVLRSQVLELMHQGHPGIVRTKLLARSHVWWPSLNADIETLCANCTACAKINFKPQPEVHSWPPAKYPFGVEYPVPL